MLKRPRVGQYHYMPYGRGFRIYRYDYVTATRTASVHVDSEPIYSNREEARKRVYELNGWRYKPCKKN